ncbi:glycosyltransferase family 9 protein [Roseospira marina]|uniref:Glycosyltransferase family 9 protein n=1 Tax=Roseospira marina TaxID=140057 RepID=A0A5M6IAR1_9PROT|nr:glycosyltransferase family 9 protein [Roseospira marina]KAA5604799.1 glycosyltransferase family 9 protein [Roseospira marina]MBB4313490.1 ADP-heptose:LPS heptosyltransferase [Roseospira marina]MBB5086652.1 ADP-heptose:LPS heptosyltransferase [Roseospira marina]
MTPDSARPRILVIKLSALGDVVLALGPMAAIRRHHPHAHLTMLTTAPYAPLLRASGLFDAVRVDRRGGLRRPLAWADTVRWIRVGAFDRVYDLQTSDRSSGYFRALRLMGAAPPWSGIAPGCAFCHDTPQRTHLHSIERQAEQLRIAGIPVTHAPDLSFAWTGPGAADVARFALPERYALLVPGGSAHRPEKRWPADQFAALARWLVAEEGLTPVLLGTTAEANVIDAVRAACPDAIALIGRTDLLDIPALGHRAALAVGNDTGPLHMIALAGCPTVALFSAASNPDKHRPRGPAVVCLQRPTLSALGQHAVRAAITQVRKAPPHDPAFSGRNALRMV